MEANARRYCTRLSTTTRTLPWRPPESTIQFWCSVSPPHVCQLCQVCPESSLPRALSLSLARRARNLLSLASLSLAVFWNPACQLGPRLQVRVADRSCQRPPLSRNPRKAVHGGISKSIHRRFVNFWQQFPTKWLQNRPQIPKPSPGIPPRRAFCGTGRTNLGTVVQGRAQEAISLVRVGTWVRG